MLLQENRVFRIIFVLLFIAIPFIIFDTTNNFFEQQFGIVIIVNLISCFLIIEFMKILKISERLKSVLFFALIAWFCVLPVIFYKIYLKNSNSFTYKKEYLELIQDENKKNVTESDTKFIRINSEFISLIDSEIGKIELPDNDTIIFYKNLIFLSPRRINGGGFLPRPTTKIKVFDRNDGSLILEIDKKNNLKESCSSFKNYIDFKNKIISNPEMGIDYFDFWCSSIIGFRDNLITPLKGWIFVLNFLFITILFVPLFNYFQNKFFREKKENS